MAEPTSPQEEPTAGGRPADQPVDDPTSASRARQDRVLLEPPTQEELAETGEPTLDEIHAAAGGAEAPPAADTAVIPPAAEHVRSAEPAVVPPPAPPAAQPEPPVVQPAVVQPAPPVSVQPAPPAPVQPAPPVPEQEQRTVPPAVESAPLPPTKRGNRLVGTAWVLLAAGLFQVVFFGINALVVLTFVGPAAIASQVQQVAQTALAWLPVLLFFLLFELTVLLFNRAGRFAYVVASLVVGIVVYIATVLLYSLMVQHTLGDSNTLAQTFLNWEFIVIGLAAREVMLWTGIAIGSRGIRVRRRNAEARAQYDQELADAQN